MTRDAFLRGLIACAVETGSQIHGTDDDLLRAISSGQAGPLLVEYYPYTLANPTKASAAYALSRVGAFSWARRRFDDPHLVPWLPWKTLEGSLRAMGDAFTATTGYRPPATIPPQHPAVLLHQALTPELRARLARPTPLRDLPEPIARAVRECCWYGVCAPFADLQRCANLLGRIGAASSVLRWAPLTADGPTIPVIDYPHSPTERRHLVLGRGFRIRPEGRCHIAFPDRLVALFHRLDDGRFDQPGSQALRERFLGQWRTVAATPEVPVTRVPSGSAPVTLGAFLETPGAPTRFVDPAVREERIWAVGAQGLEDPDRLRAAALACGAVVRTIDRRQWVKPPRVGGARDLAAYVTALDRGIDGRLMRYLSFREEGMEDERAPLSRISRSGRFLDDAYESVASRIRRQWAGLDPAKSHPLGEMDPVPVADVALLVTLVALGRIPRAVGRGEEAYGWLGRMSDGLVQLEHVVEADTLFFRMFAQDGRSLTHSVGVTTR